MKLIISILSRTAISKLTGGLAECATSLDKAKKLTLFELRGHIRTSRENFFDLFKEKVNAKNFKEYTFRGFRIKKEMGPLDHTPIPKKGNIL